MVHYSVEIKEEGRFRMWFKEWYKGEMDESYVDGKENDGKKRRKQIK